jgi:multimeric flavodoxin WrbA
MDELSKQGNVEYTEFYLPKALPVFCTGCALCQSSSHEKCPHANHIKPILDAIIKADALIFTTPHYACAMSGGLKTLFDHLDFLVLNVTPREEIFGKKAFIITTGAGSTAAIKPIKSVLKNWGINRVYSLGFRMFTNKWVNMPKKKQNKFENKLRRSAKKFYSVPKKPPYLYTVFYYHITKFVMKKYVGEGNYPYKYWQEKGYFKKRPF